MKVRRPLEASVSARPTTKLDIVEDLNLQEHRCPDIESRVERSKAVLSSRVGLAKHSDYF
jgi:hypothetical protein